MRIVTVVPGKPEKSYLIEQITPSEGKAAMPKEPKPVGLILCDRLHVDPSTGKMSLVGLFTLLRFPSFPTPARPFTAYALLYGGEVVAGGKRGAKIIRRVLC